MTFDPRNPLFWDEELAAMFNTFAPRIIGILLAGGQQAVGALPDAAAILMNWDVFNQNAIDWLNNYGMGWLKQINETSRNQVVNAIDDFIRQGKSMQALKKNIVEILAPTYSKSRAESIATTEVTRIYAEGNLLAWKSTGTVTQKRWMTARDDLVCPICAPLDGMVVDIDSNGFTTEIGGLGLSNPPAHINCRCWMTPVVDLDAIERRAATRDANSG